MSKTRHERRVEGWKFASVTGGDDLSRTLEMYEELGIETYVEKVDPNECNGCTKCFKAGNETAYRIYTKEH